MNWCACALACFRLVSLHLWRKRYGELARSESPGTGPRGAASPEELLAEIRRLQKENETLKRQRDILKKL